MRLSAYLSVFVALTLSVQAASLPAVEDAVGVADIELADRTVRTVGGCIKRIKRNHLQSFCRGYVKKYKKNGCKCSTPQNKLPSSIRKYDKAMIAEACAEVACISLGKCKAKPTTPVTPAPSDPVVEPEPTPEPTPKDPPFVDQTGCFGGAEMPADPNDLNVCANCKCEYRALDRSIQGSDVEFTRRAVDPSEAMLVRCQYDASSSSYPAKFTMPITLDSPRALGFSLTGASGGGNGRAAGPGGFTQGLASRRDAPQKGDEYDVYLGLPGQTGSGLAAGLALGGRGEGGRALGGGSGGGGSTWVTKHGAGSTDADQIIILAPGGGGAARDAIPDDNRGWGGRGRGTCRTPRDGETFQREICNRRGDGYGDDSKDPDYVAIASASRTVGADGQSGGGGGGGGYAFDGYVGGGTAGGSSYSGGAGGGQLRTEEFSGLAPDAAPSDGTGRAYVAFGCFGGQQQR